MSMSGQTGVSVETATIDGETVQQLVDTVERQQQQLETQAEYIDELESELTTIKETVNAQPTVELRGDDDTTKISDIWIGGLPIGVTAENNRDRAKRFESSIHELEDRVEKVEAGSVDANDVIDATPAELLLPIQNLYNTVKAGGEDSLNPNEARAAKVWPHFRDYADPSGGRLTLTSPKVREILENDVGMDHADSMTVKRVMQNLERYSGRGEDERIIRLETASHPNQLQCDLEDWNEATSEMMEVATGNGGSEAVADGGRDGGEK